MNQPDLSGRTALVTGGGRGIGRAASLALGRSGARVVVVGRTEPEIEAVAHGITQLGAGAQALQADVSREDHVRGVFDEAGHIDILINNAGVIQPIGPVADVDPEDWLYNVAVNLSGAFLMSRFALPSMLERGWGRIINVSSGAARGTVTGWSAYSAAKAALEAFTAVTALEVEDRGVRVNAIRPGIVDTDMQVDIRRSSEQEFGRENLLRFRNYKERGQLRDPADPARLILWLLSAEADNVNGEVLSIDDPDVADKIGLTPMGR